MHQHCFVHAAGLRLDAPFTGFRADAPGLAELLREASLDALDHLVDVALERRAAFVLLAGDLHEGSVRGLRAQPRLAAALKRLGDAGIATFLVDGTHDPRQEGWVAIPRWPEEATRFPPGEVASVPVDVDGERVAVIHGLSHPASGPVAAPASRFRRTDDAGAHIGLLHAAVEPDGAGGGAATARCTLEELRESGMDYWALGHRHDAAVLRRGTGGGDPWVVYPGTPQGRGPEPAQRGPKGCYVVPLSGGPPDPPIGEPEFVPLAAVDVDEVTVGVGEADRLADLADRLHEEGRRRLATGAGRPLLLRGRLTGRSALRTELARPDAVEGVLRGLRDAAQAAGLPLWWDHLLDESRPAPDRDPLIRRPDLTGHLVALVDRLRADPDEADALSREASAILGQLHPPPRSTGQEDVLADAETRALDLLAEEG